MVRENRLTLILMFENYQIVKVFPRARITHKSHSAILREIFLDLPAFL